MAKNKFLVGANALFSPHGRINRLQFSLNFWVCQVLTFLLLLGVVMLADVLSDDLMAHIDGPVTWLSMVLIVLIYYACFCLMAQRLHDTGLTAWLALVLFAGIVPNLIAFVGRDTIDYDPFLADTLSLVAGLGNMLTLFMGIGLSVWPGKTGDNKYGPSPNTQPQADTPQSDT
ncbi:hypothetical protein AEAC466_13155 [Asticcacaulis sp. AC466]|uniref:DUF805 domain-containing protein n=1 Tax=Asticcacaulis sp. AC466 TaxID=1282362 RepID=UPI0003C4025E|nr:DUF805 domain-containing protein [Asticcacaulis sp. AC466]ESQ83617.1 hypothetical protein AEAC466_13155 [Asticcacaulis sp. AC466]